MKKNAILIFDIGKTNKKYYLFDENYQELKSEYIQFKEVKDDDSFEGDDLTAISNWVLNTYHEIKNNNQYELKFINFSTYGATLVHLNKDGKPCTPLYNYLKPFPDDVKQLFIQLYGDMDVWSMQTSSPYLGMLNAGLQLFWVKYKKPELFKQISQIVFLPQYLNYLFTGNLANEFTSLGCHTGMWNFNNQDYHSWIYNEKFVHLLPPIVSSSSLTTIEATGIKIGAGIHDSSAALIPYLKQTTEPFMLLSTGTWSICMNPFNNELLTIHELKEDCLCFMQPDGRQVKASRFFLGGFFSECLKQLNKHFSKDETYHQHILVNEKYLQKAKQEGLIFLEENKKEKKYQLKNLNVKDFVRFENFEEAYHQFIAEAVEVQVQKIYLAKGSTSVRKIYIDGGFAKNNFFLTILQYALPGFDFIASESPLASSLGAAIITKEI